MVLSIKMHQTQRLCAECRLDILEAARARHYGTVVVGRESFRGLKALLTSHVGDTLMRQAHDLTVWVVE